MRTQNIQKYFPIIFLINFIHFFKETDINSQPFVACQYKKNEIVTVTHDVFISAIKNLIINLDYKTAGIALSLGVELNEVLHGSVSKIT